MQSRRGRVGTPSVAVEVVAEHRAQTGGLQDVVEGGRALAEGSQDVAWGGRALPGGAQDVVWGDRCGLEAPEGGEGEGGMTGERS